MSTKEIMSKYCVYTNKDGQEILGYACTGYFASDAFRESDEQFSSILGSKFGIITADDAKEYVVNKNSIRRLKDEFEFNKLMEDASPFFEVAVKLCDTCIGSEVQLWYKITLDKTEDNGVRFMVYHGASYVLAPKKYKKTIYSETSEEWDFSDVMLALSDLNLSNLSNEALNRLRLDILTELSVEGTTEITAK